MTFAAVSDAGPVIHLAEIDSLELLSAFDTLLVPETVSREIERGSVPDGISDPSYELVAAEDGFESEELDAGERAALAVTREREPLDGNATGLDGLPTHGRCWFAWGESIPRRTCTAGTRPGRARAGRRLQ